MQLRTCDGDATNLVTRTKCSKQTRQNPRSKQGRGTKAHRHQDNQTTRKRKQTKKEPNPTAHKSLPRTRNKLFILNDNAKPQRERRQAAGKTNTKRRKEAAKTRQNQNRTRTSRGSKPACGYCWKHAWMRASAFAPTLE